MSQIRTREKILGTAFDLFYQHGFHAVGLDRILLGVGVTKTTFYNHFESKDHLILEVIQERDRWWQKTFREEISTRGGDDPLAQLRSVFDVLSDWFSSREFRGCLFINAASEFPCVHEPAHQGALANFVAIRGIIQGLAEQAGLDDPPGFAQKLSLLIEGAITTEVIQRNQQAASSAACLAELLIDSALSANCAS